MSSPSNTGSPNTGSPNTGSPNTGSPNGPDGQSVTAVVSNPSSGSAAEEGELRAAFAAITDATVWLPTTEDDPGTGQAQAAVDNGASTVVACGGDGTVRAVMESVAGTTSALGIVPLGTGNLLAANLGLETGLAGVPVAVAGVATVIDIGTINGERFAVMAGIGFDALMIRDANATLKRRIGTAAYVLSAARNLRTRVFIATVHADEQTWTGRTVMVLVGNYGVVSGGLEVFPNASPTDGLLDVAALSAKGIRQWSSVVWRLLRGRRQRPELVHRLQGRRISIAVDRPMPYELDGEIRPATQELTISVEPLGLQVRVPGN